MKSECKRLVEGTSFKREEAELGRESLDQCTNFTKSWPNQQELQIEDCPLEELHAGRKQVAREPYTDWWLPWKSVALSPKLRRSLKTRIARSCPLHLQSAQLSDKFVLEGR